MKLDQKAYSPDATPEECWESLQKTTENFPQEDRDFIARAYRFACKAHEGQMRCSGQPYVIHPILVAEIVAKLGMDKESIVAALLHDVIEDTDVTYDEVKQKFGDEVAVIVDGVTKLGKVPLSTKEEVQAENIRKMLLAMSQDIRVIIIKLADRLHNMRTLEYKKPQKQRDTALETLEIYAPIAHRLGIRALKEELEDRAISYLDPIGYRDIEQSLRDMGQSNREYLQEIQERISDRILKSVKGAHIEGRVKSVHGIYRKMYMQNHNFNEIYDIFAVRIIVDTVIDCYNCLGIIHDMYKPIPGRFKDYISTPKPNMYQSLHTTVIGKEGIPFEVQIRTWEMHYTAEYGIAAHWKYKLGVSGKDDKFQERLTWIRQLLERQSDAEDVEDIVRTIKSDLVPEEVFVFTPKGDVIDLPSGATVIDFAYAIHSAVGNRMVGAKVDGRIVPLDYKVKTGEIVEVLTSSQQGKGPSRDWLKIVKTSEARSKIRSWFKKERRDENIREGMEEIEREFRRNNIRLTGDSLNRFLLEEAERQHCSTLEDFYAAIGYGGISVQRLMPRFKEDYYKLIKSEEPQQIQLVPEAKQRRSTSSGGVVVEGIDNCLIKLSRCCNPLPGDDIIGFITRGHGVSIHKRDCPNVPKSIPLASEPERWISAHWEGPTSAQFKSTLAIVSVDRVGLLADVSGKLAEMRVMIHSLSTRELKNGLCAITITITVNGAEHLRSVMDKLRTVRGVERIERTGV